MTAFAIANPYPVILSLAGAGLNGGQVYIGLPNQDPQSFPQAVYWDAALTIPASQPLTVTGGYVTRSGTPATPYVAGYYSLKVLNAQGALVFYDAAVGPVGEYVSSTVASGSAVTLTTNVAANVTSISLTAGDWNVWGNVAINPAIGTTITNIAAALSTTSGSVLSAPNAGGYTLLVASFTVSQPSTIPAGFTRVVLAATTTVYLVTQTGFSGGACSAYGFIGARRVA